MGSVPDATVGGLFSHYAKSPKLLKLHEKLAEAHSSNHSTLFCGTFSRIGVVYDGVWVWVWVFWGDYTVKTLWAPEFTQPITGLGLLGPGPRVRTCDDVDDVDDDDDDDVLLCSTLSTVSALSDFTPPSVPLSTHFNPCRVPRQPGPPLHVIDLCIRGVFVYRYIHRRLCAGEAEKV